jgi:hypothetical protein
LAVTSSSTVKALAGGPDDAPAAPLPGAEGADRTFDRTFAPPSPRPPLVGAAATRSTTAPSGRASGSSGLTFADSRFPGYEALGRASGKLNMCFSTDAGTGACDGWWMCSASLIGKSLLVTAAHCVHKFGRKAGGWPAAVGGKLQLYWQPGLVNGTAPYGEWWAEDAMVGSPYFNGTDTCDSYGPGVSCNNDLVRVGMEGERGGRQRGRGGGSDSEKGSKRRGGRRVEGRTVHGGRRAGERWRRRGRGSAGGRGGGRG